MKTYTSFDEIDADLKRLKLRKQIALETLKGSGHHIKNELQPDFWWSTIWNAIKKYGILYLIRRLFK
ncbi:DUF6327 family protein [Maribacter sp. 2-571]|uniref:DUF6327 family protein n=1 Tax=Maribacter sp. 2-571 TaxID=3417569 RepID=UPI003D332BAD